MHAYLLYYYRFFEQWVNDQWNVLNMWDDNDI